MQECMLCCEVATLIKINHEDKLLDKFCHEICSVCLNKLSICPFCITNMSIKEIPPIKIKGDDCILNIMNADYLSFMQFLSESYVNNLMNESNHNIRHEHRIDLSIPPENYNMLLMQEPQYYADD